jgi:hypothetical protein
MLRFFKLNALRAARVMGLNSVALKSRWRQQRLLILCYHGVAIDDEHLWRPTLFVSKDVFAARMQALQDQGCAVLPLGEALERLRKETLPRRAVALTFDDGNYDFYAQALPILRKRSLPATVYLTTYYSKFNRPVFNVMLSYLLWKRRGTIIDIPDLGLHSRLLDGAGLARTEAEIRDKVRKGGLSAVEKDTLLSTIGNRLCINYEELCRRRILHIMNPEEVRLAAQAGVDIQLHTHRHRTPRKREPFLREINDNRQGIALSSSTAANHFCYPCGVVCPEHLTFFEEAGIASATTCKLGLATQRHNYFLLPRVLDSSGMTPDEFEAWISGVAAILPLRSHPPLEESVLEEIAPNF